MAQVCRFPIVRYNPDRVTNPGRMVGPPYDVISESDWDRLVTDETQYHSLQLEAPPEGPHQARELVNDWLRDEILIEDMEGMVVVQQRYIGPDGVRRTRTGVLAALELEEPGTGSIHPHEQTFPGPIEDRTSMLKTVGFNTSPVLMMYDDPKTSLVDMLAAITDEEPDLVNQDREHVQTAAWFIQDESLLNQLEEAISGNEFLIADGHHRYSAAWAHLQRSGRPLQAVGGMEYTGPSHKAARDAGSVLALIANSADPGIHVFGTHRVLWRVTEDALAALETDKHFTITEHDDATTAFMRLETLTVPGFVVLTPGRARVFAVADTTVLDSEMVGVSAAQRSLDVAVLHKLVIDEGLNLRAAARDVTYTRSLNEAVASVNDEDASIAFCLRSTGVERIHEVSQAGEILPQKTTYFFPKAPTGVAFRKIAQTS